MVVTTLLTIEISGFCWIFFHNAMNTVKMLLEPGEEVCLCVLLGFTQSYGKQLESFCHLQNKYKI